MRKFNIRTLILKSTNVLLSIFAIFLLLNNELLAEVYKWTDENGRVHYGSKPPGEIKYKEVDIKTEKSKFKNTNSQLDVLIQTDGENYSVSDNDKDQNKKISARETFKVIKSTGDNEESPTNNKLSLSCQPKKNADCSNKKLSRSNYGGFDIYQVNFDNSNLEASDFKNARIDKTSFRNADLKNSNFSGANLNNIDFSGANLSNSNFNDISCGGCIFDQADLTNVNFSGNDVFNASFKNSNMQGFKFSGQIYRWVMIDLRNAENFNKEEFFKLIDSIEVNRHFQSLKYTHNGCDIGVKNTNCENINLSNHKFLPVMLENAKFIGANLSGADLSYTYIRSSDFTNANLENAKLAPLDRDWSNTFVNAIMRYIKFTGKSVYADFSKVDFTDTDLSEIDFKRSNLSSANLTGAKLNKTNLKKAKIDNTIFDNAKTNNTQFDNSSLANSKIDECETCKKNIEFGKIDVKAIKEYLLVEQDISKLNKNDKDAYNDYLELRLKARDGISILVSGAAILEEDDLVEIISLMLSEKSKIFYEKAYRVIDKYNEKAWNAGTEPTLCLNDAIINTSLHVMSYENEKLDKFKGANNSRIAMGSARVRKDAAQCLSQSVEYNPKIQQAFITRFEKETHIDVKKSLVGGFIESKSDISLPALTELLNSDDSELSSAAAYQLSTWKQPPKEILPWLLNEIRIKSFIPAGYLELLESYGASAKDNIAELEEIYKIRNENNWTVHDLRSAIEYIKSRSS